MSTNDLLLQEIANAQASNKAVLPKAAPAAGAGAKAAVPAAGAGGGAIAGKVLPPITAAAAPQAPMAAAAGQPAIPGAERFALGTAGVVRRVSLWTWIKGIIVVALALTVGLVIVTLLFGKGCKKTDKSLLCAISNFGKDVGGLLGDVVKYFWLLIAAGIAGVLAFFGFKKKKGGE